VWNAKGLSNNNTNKQSSYHHLIFSGGFFSGNFFVTWGQKVLELLFLGENNFSIKKIEKNCQIFETTNLTNQ
jgi:hypothetical protein